MEGRGRKVLLAMSGGVDSSVAASLLLDRGYEVVGCFMRLGSPGEPLDELVPSPAAAACAKPTKIGHQGCCSINDAQDARTVAAKLGIPFYVANFKREFGRIMDYFVDEYAAGRTPNPCVRCNDWLKFGKLRDYARQINADFVASGHYARVEPGPDGRPRLLAGLDEGKDQSDVLFGVPRDHLPHMLLPIGAMHKADVRERARQLGLPVFDKPDSQEICFVPDNDYAGFIERRRPTMHNPGPIVDESGRVLGEHAGHHRFTIGQRRGLGVSGSMPLFVLNRDPASNTVTVGPRERLLVGSCIAGEANWLVDGDDLQRLAQPTPCFVRFRHNSDAVPAHVRHMPPAGPDTAPTPSGRAGRFEVTFTTPQEAVSPGQAIVVYDAAEPAWVLGGGWIERADTGPAESAKIVRAARNSGGPAPTERV